MHLIPRIIDGLFSFLDTLRKQHRLDWLINNRDLFPTVLEAMESKAKVTADCVFGKGHVIFIDCHLFSVFPHGGKGGKSLLSRNSFHL